MFTHPFFSFMTHNLLGMTDRYETVRSYRTIIYYLRKFQVSVLFAAVFINLQMCKIRCIKYAHFPKSSHIIIFCRNALDFCLFVYK